MALSDVLNARTEKEIRDALSADIATRGGTDKGFTETSTARKLLDASAGAQERAEALRAQSTQAGSLALIQDIPEEDGRDIWIDYLAAGVFTLVRDPSTYALHVFQLSNVAGGVTHTITANQLLVRAGNVAFTNVTLADVAEYGGSGTLTAESTLNLLFRCLTPGVTGNIPNDTATQLVTALAGVSVNNPAIGSTGTSIYRPARDPERNESILDRCGARWGARAVGGTAGTLIEWIGEAFVYAGAEKTISKWYVDDTNPRGPATIDVYLASDAGPGTAEEVAIVQAYYTPRKAAGLNGPALALPAVAKPVSFTADLKNSTNASVLSDAAAVVATLNAESPLGSSILYRNEVIERLMSIKGMINIPSLSFEDTTLLPGENLVLSGTFTLVA